MSSIKQKQSLLAFYSCHQGASHKRTGKVCQDYAFARYNAKTDFYAVAIVSDGHGSNNYFRSNIGSELAVNETRDAIKHFMKIMKKADLTKLCPAKLMHQLEQNIIYNWRNAIRFDYQQNPFSEEEVGFMSEKGKKYYEADPENNFVKAYGATLIAVVIYPKHFWFGLQIGDGKCVAQYADGQLGQPIPWDDKCFLNVTTSLCDEKPLDNFRYCFHTDNFPTAIFVGSDGVDDSFANDEDLYGFYQEVIHTFQEKKYDEAQNEIDAFLPQMSEKGSGDDISISGIINSNNHEMRKMRS